MRYSLCCTRCGRDYDDDGRRLCCECGGMLDLRFEPSFRPGMAAGRPYDQWRYREAVEDTARAALEAAGTYVHASHVYNPWFLQGTKTIEYEVDEQLRWTAPD